jgi:hypothetical protein
MASSPLDRGVPSCHKWSLQNADTRAETRFACSTSIGAQSSPDKQTYERKIIDRFGGQKEFEFIVPPQPDMKEAAN